MCKYAISICSSGTAAIARQRHYGRTRINDGQTKSSGAPTARSDPACCFYTEMWELVTGFCFLRLLITSWSSSCCGSNWHSHHADAPCNYINHRTFMLKNWRCRVCRAVVGERSHFSGIFCGFPEKRTVTVAVLRAVRKMW